MSIGKTVYIHDWVTEQYLGLKVIEATVIREERKEYIVQFPAGAFMITKPVPKSLCFATPEEVKP